MDLYKRILASLKQELGFISQLQLELQTNHFSKEKRMNKRRNFSSKISKMPGPASCSLELVEIVFKMNASRCEAGRGGLDVSLK